MSYDALVITVQQTHWKAHSLHHPCLHFFHQALCYCVFIKKKIESAWGNLYGKIIQFAAKVFFLYVDSCVEINIQQSLFLMFVPSWHKI